ncbi:putative E3 ubiquitin-protein ligase ubr7 [Phtheirospermum japonicum]|uniref:Putative E3 ubiquitin-protein ligase ubr7 n=1 Tax=Phtheirospermum japonicum TaxID=374723 RepID=A0A830DJC6_9LAMI|nr:putative E3 ubiquitin-protein ligase ubr7 [Phtheirospermum japonicum]
MTGKFDDEVEGESTISIKDYLAAVEEEELVGVSNRSVWSKTELSREKTKTIPEKTRTKPDPFFAEADLVLGGDEGKECTYGKGYMKRQAVFSCLTCTPDGNAGVCTACSLSCHEGHEIVELWTKRNFRCDCGNSKFGEFFCKLLASKDVENSNNLYNHNFKGTYCTCDLPFPDPNAEEQEDMIQCCICEDWFHEDHIGFEPSDKIPRDEGGVPLYEDFICQGCATVCSFLSHYPQTILASDISSCDKGKAVLEVNPDIKVNECPEATNSSTKCIIGIDLAGNPPTTSKSKPMFLSKNWRELLCRCEKCSEFYAQKGIRFVADKEDSIAEYEKMAKQRRTENLQKQEGVELNFLNNLGHVAKMELLSGIADMKNEFCAFLESTDLSKPITTEDVQQVFEKLAKKRKRELAYLVVLFKVLCFVNALQHLRYCDLKRAL